jgi:hypothetical protein
LFLDDFIIPHDADTKSQLEREIATCMIKLHIAPNSLPILQPLINAACNHGCVSKFISCTLPHRNKFVEEVIEGDKGLLHDVVENIFV